MKCPQCQKEVEHTFQTAIGIMCRDCTFTAAAYLPPQVKVTQMEMFNLIAPHYEAQFLTLDKGAVNVAIQEVGCKKVPQRIMLVGFRDRKTNTFIRHAVFSCS